MSNTKLMSKKTLKADKKKEEDTMDFGISIDGVQRFFAMHDFSDEDMEACVDFFEKFVKQDLPKYLKAQEAIQAYVNAALCGGDDDLRDQRIEVLGRIDQFLTDIADFRVRFSDGYEHDQSIAAGNNNAEQPQTQVIR